MTFARCSHTILATLFLACPLLRASAEEAAPALGKKVFLEISQPQCGLCHTLADAGTTGQVGPILDELKPTADRVRTAVINGIGPMPPNTILTKEEIEALAIYVSTAAGNAPP